MRLSIWLLPAVVAFGCGGDSNAPAVKADVSASVPSGEGVCALLMQGEVDELFESPGGTGRAETLSDGIELCSWPPGDDPWLMVQVGPPVPDIRQAVSLGDEFEVHDLSGLSGPAAMAVVPGADGFVVVIALQAGEKTLTLSPLGLQIPSSGAKFDALKATLDRAASRL